jgi:cytochrome c553
MQMLDTADPVAGKVVAEREDCVRCHGINGVADKITQPNIAGINVAYLYKQLRDYKDGTREHRRMNRYVRELEDKELADLAAWYASQPGPQARASQATADAATELVRRGDGRRLIPACAACHGAAGEGNWIGVPALAGQNVEYFIETMLAYQTGDRANDVYSTMRTISAELSEEEIILLAEYYAGLGAFPASE